MNAIMRTPEATIALVQFLRLPRSLSGQMATLKKRGAPEPPSVLLAAPTTHGGVPAAYTSDMRDRVTEWRFFGNGQVFLPGGVVAFASYWVPSWSEVDDAINP